MVMTILLLVIVASFMEVVEPFQVTCVSSVRNGHQRPLRWDQYQSHNTPWYRMGTFYQLMSHRHLHDFDTENKDGFIPEFEEIEEILVDTVAKQEQLKKYVKNLEERVINDENEVQTIVKIVYKVLPVLSII